MSSSDTAGTAGTAAAMAQQRALYGEPLGQLVGRLRERFGLTQARFAALVGLSAPMLSQLSSGQRVKIGNPAVVRRLEALIELSERADGLGADQVQLELERIAGDTSTLADTRRSTSLAADLGEQLRHLADSASLLAAAAAVEDRAPALSAVLRRAADG